MARKKKTELTKPVQSTIATPTPAATEPTPKIAAPVAIASPPAFKQQTVTQPIIEQPIITQTIVKPPTVTAPAIAPPSTDIQNLTTDSWPSLWQRLPLAGVIRNTASHCCLESIDGNNYHFILNHEQAGLFDPSHAARLAETLGAFLNKTCAVFITAGTPSTSTPHQVQQQKRALQQLEAEESFRSDANVLALLQQFEGEIIADTIAPFQKSIH